MFIWTNVIIVEIWIQVWCTDFIKDDLWFLNPNLLSAMTKRLEVLENQLLTRKWMGTSQRTSRVQGSCWVWRVPQWNQSSSGVDTWDTRPIFPCHFSIYTLSVWFMERFVFKVHFILGFICSKGKLNVILVPLFNTVLSSPLHLHNLGLAAIKGNEQICKYVEFDVTGKWKINILYVQIWCNTIIVTICNLINISKNTEAKTHRQWNEQQI